MKTVRKSIALFVLATVAAWGLTACGGGVECGDGTKTQNDKCVPTSTLKCANGTVAKDGECVINEDGCGTGTQVDDSGTCVAAPEACAGDALSYDADANSCVAVETCGADTKLDEANNECVPDTSKLCADNAKTEDGKCVGDTAKLCGQMAGAVEFDSNSGRCVISENACGEGTVKDANTGTCVLGESCQSGKTWDSDQSKCVDTSAICDQGTTFKNGLCVPDATCQMGDVILNGQCVSPAQKKAANPDVQQQENDDPAMGGTANSMMAKSPGMDSETVFTGTIDKPKDLDGDGQVDQDRDVFKFSANAGDWFQVSVQSTGLNAPFFTIEGPDGFTRWAPTGTSGDTARMFVAPKQGDYMITVYPREIATGPSGTGPIGSADSTYVGTLDAMMAPSATGADFSAMDSHNLTGSAENLTDNFFELKNLDAKDIYAISGKSFGADADFVLQIWKDATTLETTVDPLKAGASKTLDEIMSGNRFVLVDWKKSWGPTRDFDLQARKSGTSKSPSISAGGTDTTTVTVTPFTTLEVTQKNGSSSDVDVEITDANNNSVASETLSSGSTLSQLLQQPGSYTVTVTNNTSSNLTVDLTVNKVPPTDLGTLPTGSRATGSVGSVGDTTPTPVKFELKKGQIAELSFDSGSSFDDLDVQFYDSSAAKVGPETEVDEQAYSYGGDNAAYVYADAKKTYYATFLEGFGSLSGVTLRGKALQPTDWGTVADGDSKSATISEAVSVGYSRFVTFAPNAKLGITASGTPSSDGDSELTVRQSDFFSTGENNEATNPTLEEALVEKNRAFVEIRADDDLDAGYKLDASFSPPPVQESEPNDTAANATATNPGSKHTGQIQSGDTDFWSINLQSALGSNEILMIEVSGASEYDDWACDLLDGSSNSVKSLKDKDEGCTLLVDGLSMGTYDLKVTMDDSTQSPYSLRVNRVKGTLEAEPNDGAGAANSLTYSDWTNGTPAFGEVPTSSDTDYMKFNLASALGSNERLIIDFANVGQEKETLDLALEDSSNSSLASINDGESIIQSGLSSGDYYLVVDGGSSFEDNQYRISANVYSPDKSVTASPGKTFPDNDPNGISTSVSASGCATVTDVTVDFDIATEDWQDIQLELTNPAGTTVVLKLGDVDGGTGTSWTENIPLTYTPANPLTPFEMASGNGTWKLHTSDRQVDTGSDDGQGGTLNSWTLNLMCQ